MKGLTTRLGSFLQAGHCAEAGLLPISKHDGTLFYTVSVTPAICIQRDFQMEVPTATGNICHRVTLAFPLHQKKSEISISDPLPNEGNAKVVRSAGIGIPITFFFINYLSNSLHL